MKFQIEYAPRSARDLAEIQAYIARAAQSRSVADRFVDRLLEACERLDVFPERFPRYPFARSWRMMPFENYLVFFRIEGDAVRIGHIRHAAQKPLRD